MIDTVCGKDNLDKKSAATPNNNVINEVTPNADDSGNHFSFPENNQVCNHQTIP